MEAWLRIIRAVCVAVLLATVPGHAGADPEAGAPGAPQPDRRPGAAFADPEVARLQHAATGVQRELGDLAAKVQGAEHRLRTATDAATAAHDSRVRADQVVAGQQAEVDAYSADRVLLPGPAVRGPRPHVGWAGELPRRLEPARAGCARTRTSGWPVPSAGRPRRNGPSVRLANALADAADRRADLDDRTADASERADAVAAELAGVAAEHRRGRRRRRNRDQRQRNDRTAASWRAYLGRLAKAGVVPPPAAALRDPARLPAGLSALAGKGGPQRGVARITLPSGEVLLVLPKETIAAVTVAVGALGHPYVPARGGTGPAAYSCDGLVRSAFGTGGLPLPARRGGPVRDRRAGPGRRRAAR